MGCRGSSMRLSNSAVDKAGCLLSSNNDSDVEKYILAEESFEEYRRLHLEPLMQMMRQLQEWMDELHKGYYIAMRLKRRPQILRKLRRLSVRLSQLQDIAGARIILDRNADVDEIARHLLSCIEHNSETEMVCDTDYRDRGRDDSGYRARHIVMKYKGVKIELQLRSRIQHYWAETIERTSVVYGHYLKELEGDIRVLAYFKELSNILYEFEAGRKPSLQQRVRLDRQYQEAHRLIQGGDRGHILMKHSDKSVLKTLTERSSKLSVCRSLLNWILIFDWNIGSFVEGVDVSGGSSDAIQLYAQKEKQYPSEEHFEVVLIGASDVATIEQTHSHYFGIARYDSVLKNLDDTIDSIQDKSRLTIDEWRIVMALYTRKFWGTRMMARATIKNHLCEGLSDFDNTVDALIKKGLLIGKERGETVSLSPERKAEIEQLMG